MMLFISAVAVVVGFTCAGAQARAADPMLGTWTLNAAKSTTTFKSASSIVEAAGDGVKATVDIVTSDGTAYHWTWTATYDGTDVPVAGTSRFGSGAQSVALTRIDARIVTIVTKFDGKAAITQTLVISPDGKTRTTTTIGQDAKGQPIESTAVFDKQP